MPIFQIGDEQMKYKGKTIMKNKKCNTWYTRYRENGKQVYISGKTQKEVLQKLKDSLKAKKVEYANKYTLLEWYNRWIVLFKQDKVKDSTLRVYKALINHIDSKLLNKNITDITSLEIVDCINNIKGSRTKQKVYEMLQDIYHKAELHDITNNIIKKIDKPKHTRINGIALTSKDEVLFIKECERLKYYGLLIGLYQGLRKGEILGITRADIQDTKLVINKSLNSSGLLDTTKNTSSNRIMPLFDKTKNVINKIDSTSDRLINISNATLQKQFEIIIKNTAISNKYTIHSLRHTFITKCKDLNIPEHIIQSWVGHTIGSKVTSTVYTHIKEDTNLLYINKLNNT